MSTTIPIRIDDIQAAARTLKTVAHRTPVITCQQLDRIAGRQLYFKCENFQRVGAFKFRGAYNAIARLPESTRRHGVVTHSSGNHAQAVALAARLFGIPATIVMPENSAAVKRSAVAGYGATIIDCQPNLESRESATREFMARSAATLIHPYDDPDIIAGQGTAALELLEEVSELDAVIAPVGGGGLISGTSIVAHGLSPSIRVFAAEPQGADDAAQSMRAGRRIPQSNPQTIADGLRTSLGERNWPIIRDHVEQILTVTDEEIVRAMRLLWERAKLLVETNSATTLAAVLHPDFPSDRNLKKIGVILSGGNVDLDALPWLP